MVLKKIRRGIMETIKDGIVVTSDSFISHLGSKIKEETDIIGEKVERRLVRIEKVLVSNILTVIFLFLGVLSIFAGAGFYLIEYHGMSKTIVLFILGGLLIVAGFISRFIVMKGGE